MPVDDETAPVPDNDIAAPSGLGDLAVHARSIHRRTHDEQIDATLATTGTYYLAVSGYNGATNREPYALRLKKLGSADARQLPVPQRHRRARCPDRSRRQLPAGTNTVFVLNQSRLGGLYGTAEAGAVRSGLDQLVSYLNAHAGLGVKAAVLPVDADAGVRAAYAAWDAAPCDPEPGQRRGRPDRAGARHLPRRRRGPRPHRRRRWRRRGAVRPGAGQDRDRQRARLREHLQRRPPRADLEPRGRLRADRRRLRRRRPLRVRGPGPVRDRRRRRTTGRDA